MVKGHVTTGACYRAQGRLAALSIHSTDIRAHAYTVSALPLFVLLALAGAIALVEGCRAKRKASGLLHVPYRGRQRGLDALWVLVQ